MLVEELHYGAVAVAQRLEDLRPDLLILVGAVVSGRPPGTVERREYRSELSEPDVQRAIGDAVTGYVGIDLVLEVAAGLGALPPRAIAIEVEPAQIESSEKLSPEAEAALEQALDLVREELARARPGSGEGSPAGGPPASRRPESRRPTS